MSRARRPKGRARTVRRKRDWTYRGFSTPLVPASGAVAIGVLEDTSQGAYSPLFVSETGGVANSSSRILYDSVNRQVFGMGELTSVGTPGSVTWQTRAARAEGRKPVCYAVEGKMLIIPDTWTIGSLMAFGARLGIWDQDPETGGLLVPGDYSMWVDDLVFTSPFGNVATWANTHYHFQEKREWKYFGDTSTTPMMVIKWRWKSRQGRAMRPDEALGIYIELPAASVALRIQTWMRALIADEG